MPNPVAPRTAPRLPDFVIAGAMRSGSSSLFRYLHDHPDIFMPRQKELHYFDRGLHRGFDWYTGNFADALPGQVVGEATPAYLADEAALARMVEAIPSVRVILTLRDPVSRAYSHYWMNAHRKREPRSWAEVADSDLDKPGSVLWHSRYAHHLEILARLVPPERRLVIGLDDLIGAPVPTFRMVCDFLGVAHVVPASVGRKVNQNFRVRSTRVRMWSKRPWVPPLMRSLIARVNQVPTVNPPMDVALQATLNRAFEADRAAMQAAITRPPA